MANWESGILYNAADTAISVDWLSRELRDNTGTISMSWVGREMYDISGNVSVDYGNRSLYDVALNISIDWDGRQLLGNWTTDSPFRLFGYTVATLPVGIQGDTAYVTDALAPAYLAIAVGGGAVVTPVFFDGTNWVTA